MTTGATTLGQKIAYIDGQATTLDVYAKIKGNRTLVPLRFVSESLGAKVEYISATERIVITSDIYMDGYEAAVVKLINAERAKHGVKPLDNHQELGEIAQMVSNSLFEDSPYKIMAQFDISYRTASTSLVSGMMPPFPEAVVSYLMRSSEHRDKILNTNFTHIGVGCLNRGLFQYWTLLFVGK